MRLLIFFVLSINSFALCDFPHNPPFLCLEGRVTSIKPIKSKKFKCLVKANVRSLKRPIDSYTFNKNLDKVTFTSKDHLNDKTISFYSVNNCEKKNLFTILEYNCSEKNSDLKDLTLFDLHTYKREVVDQWTEKKSVLDCSKFLPSPKRNTL